eukprot:04723.XXX_140820_141005_1 [CDS] Oithona nana genome sequencing.
MNSNQVHFLFNGCRVAWNQFVLHFRSSSGITILNIDFQRLKFHGCCCSNCSNIGNYGCFIF